MTLDPRRILPFDLKWNNIGAECRSRARHAPVPEGRREVRIVAAPQQSQFVKLGSVRTGPPSQSGGNPSETAEELV
jgi:hypothetical protein